MSASASARVAGTGSGDGGGGGGGGGGADGDIVISTFSFEVFRPTVPSSDFTDLDFKLADTGSEAKAAEVSVAGMTLSGGVRTNGAFIIKDTDADPTTITFKHGKSALFFSLEGSRNGKLLYSLQATAIDSKGVSSKPLVARNLTSNDIGMLCKPGYQLVAIKLWSTSHDQITRINRAVIFKQKSMAHAAARPDRMALYLIRRGLEECVRVCKESQRRHGGGRNPGGDAARGQRNLNKVVRLLKQPKIRGVRKRFSLEEKG